MLFLLGSPTLETGGTTAALDTRKAIALLAYLALHDQPFQRDTLAALFWPELDQSRARAALRRTLTPLNRALGEHALLATRDTVTLNPDYSLWVDSRAFHQLLAETAAHGHPPGETCPRCLAPLAQAAALYRGDFLEGFTLRDSPEFDDWQYFQAEQLRRQYASLLERLAGLYARRGEPNAALEHARRWLALDTLHEPAHRLLMRLHAQAGNRAAALRQYRACLRILDEELGVPPLEETQRLYESILEGRADTPSPPAAPPPAAPPAHTQLPLIGRAAEMHALAAAHQRAAGAFAVIEGELGIGKTRLARDFLAQAEAQGAVVIRARCYEGESQLAYAPFIAALRAAAPPPRGLPPIWQAEIHRLLPELAAEPPPEPSARNGAAQSRLFEAVRRWLAQLAGGSTPAPQPGILFLDDLQWADTASVDLLAYLVRHDPGLLILGAWRSEGVPPAHPLRLLLAEAQRSGSGVHLPLQRLQPAHVAELASRFADVPPALRARLYAETDGLPFFVIEYLQAAPLLTEAGSLPPGIHDIQQARLARLDETGRQLLAAAAVIGRSFDLDTLRAASGRSEEETVAALETLLAHGLLVERQPRADHPPEYDFTHETLHNVVYAGTSLARRRLLHRRTAEALAAPRRGELDAQASQIARHYQFAGREPEAAEYFRRAGDYASRLYANTEALAHYRAALALHHPHPALHEAIGDLLTLRGEYRAAVLSYENAASLSGEEHLPQLELKLGNLHHRRGDYDLAGSHFAAALDLLADSNPALRAQILIDWSRTAAQQGDAPRGCDLAQRGLQLAAAESAAGALGQAHNILGIIARRERDFPTARDHLQRALEISGDNPFARVAALNNLALVLADEAQYDEAIRLAGEALETCTRLGDRHREAALRNHLADFHHAAGDHLQALRCLRAAVEIFAEIGVDAGDLQPEIWKLTEW